jgi:hypothetical protein
VSYPRFSRGLDYRKQESDSGSTSTGNTSNHRAFKTHRSTVHNGG